MIGSRIRRRSGAHRSGGGGGGFGSYTDPFTTPGAMDPVWTQFNGPSVNWLEGDVSGGQAIIEVTSNGIVTQRGWTRTDIPPTNPWTIELPFDATPGVTIGGNNGVGFLMYESSSGKQLMFGVFQGGPYTIDLHNAAGTSFGTPVSVSDYGPTSLRMRRNGSNLEFSYDIGSGWTAYTTVAIATHFTTMFDQYGFCVQTWTASSLRATFDIWDRIE